MRLRRLNSSASTGAQSRSGNRSSSFSTRSRQSAGHPSPALQRCPRPGQWPCNWPARPVHGARSAVRRSHGGAEPAIGLRARNAPMACSSGVSPRGSAVPAPHGPAGEYRGQNPVRHARTRVYGAGSSSGGRFTQTTLSLGNQCDQSSKSSPGHHRSGGPRYRCSR